MESAGGFEHAPRGVRYVGPREMQGILMLEDRHLRAAAFADACRINALSAIMDAGSGHIGTSFSVLDILGWLQSCILRPDDAWFSSKGHDAPAVYAVLAGVGLLDPRLLRRLRRLDGLPGHPDIKAVPALLTNTGSLGMGVSKAKGFARAARLAGQRRRVFVVTGDGELQEGQFWESLAQAANERFGEITVIVDHNKIQSDTWVDCVSDLGDLECKARAFGWASGRCDGHDPAGLDATFSTLEEQSPDRPKLLIADTVKGRGVARFEPHDLEHTGSALYGFHSGAPGPADYAAAIEEIAGRLSRRLGRDVELETPRDVRTIRSTGQPQSLVMAYGEALVNAAEREPRLVALDADLALDTGLVGFRQRFSARFVECGIAEQDMVSQAGGLARSGFLPAAHSFACFLTTRANEQVFNNATEGTKILYLGALAGIVPGGPGHSHQSVRDIALMASVPGMTCLEPTSEAEVEAAVEWAVNAASGPVYLRLVSVPWDLGFVPPAPVISAVGRGVIARHGTAGWIVCTGPVLASGAWGALEKVDADVGLILLPWLNRVDADWLSGVVGGAPLLCLDNHVIHGGHGASIREALVEVGHGDRVEIHGVDGIPVCGRNDEVLRVHHLDANGIAERVRDLLSDD